MRVGDMYFETPILESVPIVNEFLEVFPVDLFGIPSEREIDFARLGFWFVDSTKGGVMVHNVSESSFRSDVKAKKGGDDVLRYQGHLCVPNIDALREKVLSEAHNSPYFVHLGSTKMYIDLREVYWWNRMKRDIAEYLSRFPNCQQVKVQYLKLRGLSQDISIPTFKWVDLNMDFIVSLHHTQRQHDSIWVTVDHMKKLHGPLLFINSDNGTQFTSKFWKFFQKGLGTGVKHSTNFHPQTDGQVERSIQTLEDMFRACVIDFKDNREDHLPLIEFSYNNSYNSNTSMVLFEAVYGRRCRSPIGWFKVCEDALIGPESVHEVMEKGVMRFGKKGKLSPRYVSPSQVLRHIGKVSYKPYFPNELASVHLVFHVSLLKKCIGDPTSMVPLESLEIEMSLSYEEVLVEILYRQV
ncbi:hypothetical protein MTR67_017875 [Solanum verrucosum]|uniref:Integrase catalytic domain-containing protein n=1 Tax=Solanum verrucosum TaxID=315347 RepID=A0AAF0TSL4_SOLVR|nr:hypothetical protein MTR67_017875 [Solanum verrucosum]